MAEDDHLTAKEYSTGEWSKEWETDHGKGFHLNKINGILEKYLDRMVQGKKGVKFLFPFCGKDICMKWLAELGHNVVGCDCAPQAFKEFFEEQKTEYTTKTEGSFTIHEGQDGRLKMYCGNFYDFSIEHEGQFNIIWDRGGLNAVNPSEQTKYRDLMVSLMNKDSQYYLLNFDMDDKEQSEKYGMLTDEKITNLFDERKFNIHLRAEYVPAEQYNGDLMQGMEDMKMKEKLTILTLKL